MFGSLDDSDAVGDVKGVVVRGEVHVGLLLAIRADEGVHLGDLDLVKGLHGLLDLDLGSGDVAQEDEGVDLLDLLHGGLGGKRALQDAVTVHLGLADHL